MFTRLAYKLYGCWYRLASWFEPRRELVQLEECARGRESASRVLAELGKLYMRLDSYVNAERCLRRYVEIHPDCARAHADIAEACMWQRRYGQALKDAERALRCDRNCWLAHVVIGYTQMKLGNWTEAVGALRQAIWLSDVDEDDGRVHALLAKAYSRLGDAERAEIHRRRAEELSPGSTCEKK